MNIKVIKDDDEYFIFNIKNSEPYLTNMLRRTIIGQVPAFAIDTITVYENNSYMFDEYLAHRLGLVPLTTTENASINDEIIYTIDVQGPGELTSGDLRTKSKIKPVYDNIPIIKLREGQTVRMEASAKIGCPRKHQKFQAGNAAYNYEDPKEITVTIESFKNYPMAHDLAKVAITKIKTKIDEAIKDIEKMR